MTSLIVLLAVLVGYYLGSQRNFKSDYQQIAKDIKRKLEKDDIGPVKRPSAEKIWEMNNPLIAAEKAEMSKLLNKTFTPVSGESGGVE